MGAKHESSPPSLPIHKHQPPSFTNRRHRAKRLLAILLLLTTLVLYLSDFQSSRETRRNPAYLIKAKHGAVASENKLCSDIGVDILQQGGNAVDAGIASTLCIGVVGMYSSGIGGGGFMTVRIPRDNDESEVYTIDFRETAPALSNTTMFRDNPRLSLYGGLSVGVPGELRGLEEAYKRWGSGNISWRSLVQPSIDLAKGWRVQAELAKRITWYPDLMLNNSDWSAIFAPNGRFLKEGEIIRRTNLSHTLDKIATLGPQAFYKGPIADAVVRKVQATGGIITHEDLQNYTVKVSKALEGSYRGKRIYTSGPPTSGSVLLHMLNIFEHYDLEKEGRTSLNTHRTVEAIKFGFAARTRISDPLYNYNNSQLMSEIATKDFGGRIQANITDDRTHPSEYYRPFFDVKTDHGTSHTSIVDQDGMAVAITSTVNLIFGSQVLDPETGIILNDEMDDFSLPGVPNGFGLWPSPFNYPEPGKRPLSSTAPTIIENEDSSLHLVLGGSGGSRIFGALFQTILNLEYGLDLGSAVEYGRVHHQLYPAIADVDNIYPNEHIEGLRHRGHDVLISDVNRVAAVVNAIHVSDDGVIYAASDSRKNGVASGY